MNLSAKPREIVTLIDSGEKPERVIKIAIANKLLKQAYAIGKNKTIFDENYSPKTCF